MSPLSGSFRVTRRETVAMVALRQDLRMSKNHVARLLGRSTSTVQAWLGRDGVDNRCTSPRSRSLGVMGTLSRLGVLRVKVTLYLKGIFDTVDQALAATTDAIAEALLLRLTENTAAQQDEDPG